MVMGIDTGTYDLLLVPIMKLIPGIVCNTGGRDLLFCSVDPGLCPREGVSFLYYTYVGHGDVFNCGRSGKKTYHC